MLHVTRGQLVPYVITISNTFGADLRDVNITDRFPAGFRYVEGSARIDGVKTEPALIGRDPGRVHARPGSSQGRAATAAAYATPVRTAASTSTAT